MYIDKFYFSPFGIEKNVVSIWNGTYIVKDGEIFMKSKKITPEQFYELFVSRAKDTWFVKDFVRFFKDRKGTIPDNISSFAVYCDCKCSFLTENLFN